MNQMECGGLERRCSLARTALVIVAGFVSLSLLPGCPSRTLTITQADRINTKVHLHRDTQAREGDPLEVNIVCVYPSDLNKDVNAPLAPSQHITSDVWYKNRPQRGRTKGEGVFDLSTKQIYLLTDDNEGYGVIKHGRLRGALKDGKKDIRITGITFRDSKFKVAGGLHNSRSIIYVFPKFMDAEGEVLPIRPARFDPPGDFRRRIAVEIGVVDPGKTEEQYIKRTTPRKMNKRREKNR